MKHSTFAKHAHTFLATGPSQVGKWPTWWHFFKKETPLREILHKLFMTVYVIFYRFIEHTINPHTNLYNLASRRPRLLRAWDPVVPYNYCFWSPWLWGGVGSTLFKTAAFQSNRRSLIHVVYKACTDSYVFIIPRMKGQGRNVPINSISNTHLPEGLN